MQGGPTGMGFQPPFSAPGGPGAPSPGGPPPMNGAPAFPGAVRPPTEQFSKFGLGGGHGQTQVAPSGALPPAPGQQGFGPRPNGAPGPMPLGGPPAGHGMPMPPPSTAMPISVPYTGPPSVASGGLAGIPPGGMVGPGGQFGGAMAGPGAMHQGPPGPGFPPPQRMSGGGMPPGPPGGMPMPRPSGPVSMPGGPLPGMGMPPPPGPPGMMPPPHGPGMGAPQSVGPNRSMGMPPPGQFLNRAGSGQAGFPGMMPPPGPPGMMPPPGPPGGFQSQPPPLGPPGQPPMQPQMGPPGMQTMQQQHQQRIDPASIPRPVVASSSGTVLYDTRTPGQPACPPAAASRYVVRDRGNASPRYLRCTLSQVPHSADLASNAAMPFALVVSPLALPEPEDDQIQVVDLGDMGPVRCGRCKAYMNPFMRFMASGKTFMCNFCGHSNNTPDAYFCHLGPDGQRRDAYDRPELHRGSVEFVATNEYMIRPPMPAAHFFLIDATPAAVASGALSTVCMCISRVLDDMPSPERSLIGLATFDSVLHFYSLQPGSSQPHMLVMSDTSEPFVPDSSPVMLNLVEHKDALQALLEQIPAMFTGTRPNDSCAGAGIEAAISALTPTGGKLHCFLSALPSAGLHALKLRDAAGVGEKDKLTVLTSQDNTLKSLAATAADFQVCVDISLLAQGYMDIASLNDITSSTGGTIYQYTPFNPSLDHDQVLNDLKWNLVRPQGMEAVMRVRCSQGLEVEGYLGAFYRQPANPTDVYLPAIDCDKAVLANIRHLEKLSPGTECYLQAALLYTTVDGFRRIRVHTIALPVVDTVSSLFKGADLDSQTMAMARRVAANLPGGTLAGAREAVTNNSVATLAAYRKYCASQSSPVQLILPEALKLLPLYALSLLKGPALRDGVKLDERSMWISQMLSLPCARITPLLYPRLLPIRDLLNGSQPQEELADGVVLSSEGLEQGGVYLLENGYEALLHMDKAVEPSMVQQVLGVSSYDELLRVSQPLVLLPREDPASKALQELLIKVRIHRSSFLRLRVTRKGDPHEAAFFTMLMEDRSAAGMSYVEYLCQVHRLIQLKLQ